MNYYDGLMERCLKLGRTEFIGRTVEGYPIPLVRTGRERNATLIVASVHAREYITTELCFALLEKSGLGFDFLPVLDIDGVLLCKYGVGAVEDEERRERLIDINGSEDFSLWKANIEGVDINVNFDARWGTGKRNIRYPAAENYIGPTPESEPETRAAAGLLRRGEYAQVVCYHTKGEVVYYGFGSNFYHYGEAKEYADAVGYELTTAVGSAGGMKDYYDLISRGLGLTVEVGEEKFPHPYPESELGNLIEKHLDSMKVLYDNGRKIAARIHDGGA